MTLLLWQSNHGHFFLHIRDLLLLINRIHTNIIKTYLHNFCPLKPHFYIVKLGFTGVYIIVLFLLKNQSTHNLCFEQKYENYHNFYLKAFSFGGEIFNTFE